MDADLQLDICRIVSGFDDLSARFALSAFARIAARHDASAIEAMVERYRQGGGVGLFAEDAGLSRDIARELITYLYTASLPGITATIEEDYFESLMWRAALAHPPALSGGYFGHWRYPPEDAHHA